MVLSEQAKKHVDSCRFCWMCHHVCPVGNATGQERNTARARALGISLVERDAIGLPEITDNLYECALCGGCVNSCTTGWDPVMFTRETRLQTALDGALPDHILPLVENCLTYGNAYGVKELDPPLKKAVAAHEKQEKTLLFLGVDARVKAPEAALRAIAVLEKAGVSFTVLTEEPASGQQLEFLIGAAAETKGQMAACAEKLNAFETVVVFDPQDAQIFRRAYREWGVELTAATVSFPSYLAGLLKEGKLKARQTGREVVFQDPFQLARDLGETEEPRQVIAAFASLREMLCHGKETVWAGNLLMGEWMPQVMRRVAENRIQNARGVGAKVMVTASPSEEAALKAVPQDEVEILSLEELILNA